MKFVIAVLCVVGIAFVSSAPVEDEERGLQPEAAEPRAAEIPMNPTEHAEDRAAADGIQERGLVPGPREIVRALEDKYLTEDGKALIKSVINI